MNGPEDWPQLLRLARDYTAGRPLADDERRSALESAMALAPSSVPGTLGCSVTVGDEQEAGSFATLVSNGDLALALDEVQYQLDDGPCMWAARRQEWTDVHAMSTDSRWPTLSQRAVAAGVHQSLSIPFRVARAPGALNFYGDGDPGFRSPWSRERAALVARTAAVLLNQPIDQAEDISRPRLQRIVDERSLIGAAQGIVMARDGVDAETAFHSLALETRSQKRRLADVAAQVAGATDDDASTGRETAHGA
jgi:hypothetical protein